MGEKLGFSLLPLVQITFTFGTQGSSPEIIRLATIIETSQNNKVDHPSQLSHNLLEDRAHQ